MYTNLTQDDIETITAFFNYVDTNNSGSISVAEIQEAMSVDLDADGIITENEKIIAGQKWLDSHFTTQDLDSNQMLTLVELLVYNDTHTLL